MCSCNFVRQQDGLAAASANGHELIALVVPLAEQDKVKDDSQNQRGNCNEQR